MKPLALLHIPHFIARFRVVIQIMIKDFHNSVLNHAMAWNVSAFKGLNLPATSVRSSFLQQLQRRFSLLGASLTQREGYPENHEENCIE